MMLPNEILKRAKKDIATIFDEKDLQDFFIKNFKYYPAECAYYTGTGMPDLFDGVGLYEMKLLIEGSVRVQMKQAETQAAKYSKGFDVPCGIIIGVEPMIYKKKREIVDEFVDKWRETGQEFWLYFVERRGKPQEKWERKAISEEDVWKIVDVCRDEWERVTIIGLFYTGMRVGEFIAMREHWQEMDDDVLVIKVPFNEGKFSCKSRAGRRFIYVVDQRAIDTLQGWYKEHPEGIGKNDVTLWRHVKNLAAKAGIVNTVTPHVLRHSIASHLAWAGMSPHYIQKFMGHKKPELAMEVYIHAVEANIPHEIEMLKAKKNEKLKSGGSILE